MKHRYTYSQGVPGTNQHVGYVNIPKKVASIEHWFKELRKLHGDLPDYKDFLASPSHIVFRLETNGVITVDRTQKFV